MEIFELEPDTIDLGTISMPKLNYESDNEDEGFGNMTSQPSVNFGSGIELLMNDRKGSDKNKSLSSIEIEDITKLEDELNNLSSSIPTKAPSASINSNTENRSSDTKFVSETPSSKKSIFSGLFGAPKEDGQNVKPVSMNDGEKAGAANLGQSTSGMNENKTWDGYGKFNNVPVNLEKTQKQPELTKEEELREKFKYLRKMEDLEKKGVSLSKRYNMESELQEMIGEYETIMAEKEQSNSMKFQGKMLMACITGIEFLNNRFDPFDIKLDGWGEQINENIDEYDDIFAALHEKYKSKATMSPELKLLFQLGGSAMMVHMSNTLFKSSMPGMDDIMKQNPELMKQFTQAAVNTMGQSNPGFGGFMNNVFSGNKGGEQNGNGSGANPGFGSGNNGNREMPYTTNNGSPPSPVQTKLPERSQRTQNLPNRPDLMSARNQSNGISIVQNEGDPNSEEPRITRPEMKGPSFASSKQTDINSLLSGLKTKQINVNEEKERNEASTISVEDLKELQATKMSKSKRKQKSDKNIVSLDI